MLVSGQRPAVGYDVVDAAATLTMDQVETRNALTPELMAGIVDGLGRAAADPAVRVVVLTHAGPVFCAGADLREGRAPAGGSGPGGPGPSSPGPSSPGPGGSLAGSVELAGVLAAIQDSPLPVVARIAGPCLGGGLGLAAACDLSIAVEDVRVGFSEVRLGVAPAIISVVCLPKLRRGDALELMLTGERVAARRAVEVGLITRAVPAGELDAAVAEVVAQLEAGAPGALAATKAIVLGRLPSQRDAAFAVMAELSGRLFAGEEAAEGRAAFADKRPPAWAGPPVGPGS